MRTLLIAITLAAVTSQAHAVTIIGPANAVTRIDNLIVDGQSFDVTFVAPGGEGISFDEVFGNASAPNPPLTFTTQSTAEDAMAAVLGALSSNSVTGLLGFDADFFYIPFNVTDTTFDSWYPGINGSFTGSPFLSLNRAAQFGDTAVALFTANDAVIPEPATASLALLGLGGLMLRRRRMA